ncbi:MAG TPA: response regulator transcription factor [Rubrobacteraceae bacterium]|nr:response regulator transcription factor [Rubrobacteraceae bacterium]
MGERGTKDRPARLVLADDHDLLRRGLRSLLTGEPDLEVVGEASNGREALELCRDLRPDLVLMDVRMPVMDGLAATRMVKQVSPDTSVLMVTMHENPDYLLEALNAGAAGYVLKDAPAERLVSSIRRTLNGESPLNQELAMQLLQRLAGQRKQDPASKPPKRSESLPESLTPRELEVLQLLASGNANQQIAQTLVISRGTAKIHVERIIRKLGVSDRTQAAVRAIELGLTSPNLEQ